MKQFILILGGARSGKSRHAQDLARNIAGDHVLYVATAEPLDEEMRTRIAAHRSERPPRWETLEASTDLASAIEPYDNHELVLIDCMTLLVSNILMRCLEESDETVAQWVEGEIESLLACYERGTASWIVVSNEVGLGLVPDNRLGRIYRDLLGRANQRLAASADEVIFMVAGLPLEIKAPL